MKDISIDIKGGITAEGKKDSMIVFTKDGTECGGEIKLNISITNDCVFRFCVFEYMGNNYNSAFFADQNTNRNKIIEACIFHGTSNIQEHPISSPGIIFKNDKITIETKNLEHTVDTWGYRIQENKDYTMLPIKLAAAGIKEKAVREVKSLGKINIDNHTVYLEDVSVPKLVQSMAFVMDTRLCPAVYELAKKVDLMICESTYLSSEEEEAEKYYHLTASQAAGIAKTSNVKKLVLTHFSQRYSSNEEFVKEASIIHSNVIAVKDGDIVTFPERKRVLY